MSEGTKQDFQ